MHRELINRRTGKAGDQKWQGERLGVTDRTIRRYNQAQHIQSTPRTIVQIVTTNNLNLVPVKGNGQFLEDQAGNRYPPERAIARKYLVEKVHTHLKFHTYTTSLYSVGAEIPDWEALGIPTEIYPTPPTPQPQVKPPPSTSEFRSASPPVHPASRPSKGNAPVQPDRRTTPTLPASAFPSSNSFPRPQPVSAPPVAYQPLMSDPQDRQFFQPLADASAEQVAQRLYAEVPNLSQCNARRLVYDFGATPVARTWQWLRSQPFYAEIRNPAGYLIRKVEGQALKKRTTINPQEFHGQSYKFHDGASGVDSRVASTTCSPVTMVSWPSWRERFQRLLRSRCCARAASRSVGTLITVI
jgi:hypothetical protein